MPPTQQAEAAFKLILRGMSPEMVAQHNDNFDLAHPRLQARPASPTARSSRCRWARRAYPVSTRMGLIHTAIGNNVADYLTGRASAEDTLAKVEAAYLTSAKEAGLLK